MSAARAAFLVLLFLPFAPGCATSQDQNPGSRASSVAPPPNEIAVKSGMSIEDATRARKMYLLKCAKCHRFYDPNQYSDSEWNEWMAKMSRKSHLNSEEETLLSAYLEAFRSSP